jgi:hypothetical protein
MSASLLMAVEIDIQISRYRSRTTCNKPLTIEALDGKKLVSVNEIAIWQAALSPSKTSPNEGIQHYRCCSKTMRSRCEKPLVDWGTGCWENKVEKQITIIWSAAISPYANYYKTKFSEAWGAALEWYDQNTTDRSPIEVVVVENLMFNRGMAVR